LHELLLYLALLFFFLLLSFFFSGAETALMAVNRLKLKYQAEAGDVKAQAIKAVVANPDRLLSVILLGNNVANIAAATLVTYVISTYVPRDQVEVASLLASAILTVTVLIFCELTPKLFAATHAEEVSRRILWAVRLSVWVLSPFARLAAWCANTIVRLFGFAPATSPFTHALSEEEIRAIIAGSTAEGFTRERQEMLHNVFEIGDTQVREIMIPRTDVTAIDINDPLPEVLATIAKNNYSRIPVYRDSFDNILGILYVKDLLQHLHRPGDISLQACLRPAHFVPDTARLEHVLRQLQLMHLHMAVVVDEFGGVEGIVTLEDLLEEIVGEIRDEHDTEMEAIRSLGPDLYSVAGNLPVKDFNRFFTSKVPESREYTTVVGFLQTLTGRLLQEGENIRYHDLTFTIEKAENFKIVSIRVRAHTPKPEEKPLTARKAG
jgi:putative hemolysin